MNADKIFIPKICKVGFNPREDTYSGRLGYVIYNDGKKWRKEISWKNWIYNYISKSEYEKKKKEIYNSTIENMISRPINSDGKYQYYIPNKGWKYTDNKITIDEAKKLRPYEDFNPYMDKQSSDAKIIPFEFNNKLLDGFMLNRKVGGETYGWNPRQTYCRVYDPRGFEIEITIQNLLYILDHANCFKGKKLDGKFIYGWSGTELVLVPEAAPEYEEMKMYTELQSKKVLKRSMKPGNIYINNNNEKLTYLGDAYEVMWGGAISTKKKIWFYNHETSYERYETKSNVTTIKEDIGQVDKNFEKILKETKSLKSYYDGKPTFTIIENPGIIIRTTIADTNKFICYIKNDNKFQYSLIKKYNRWHIGNGLYEVMIGNKYHEYNSIEEIINEYTFYKLDGIDDPNIQKKK